MVSEQDEKDLKDVEVDEAIFEDANKAVIKIFPIEINEVLHEAIGGLTYPFKTVLKDNGFKFSNTVNGVGGVNLWLREMSEAQPEMDTDDLQAHFEEYGFTVEKYDGVGADEEQADDEEAV